MTYDVAEHEAHHYEEAREVPKAIKKYWKQRYNIFSKYDDGIWMTDDAWFGVTPEPVANKIAQHVAHSAPAEKRILIDCFGGAGGNTIAFALSGRWDIIFAVEQDPQVLKCAKHNAEIYGVSNKIWWIEGDIFKVLKTTLKNEGERAVIFASPPWGGPGYLEDDVFNLENMQPYSLDELYGAFSAVSSDVALFLPRTSDLNQLARCGARKDKKVQAIHYCVEGASKAICVYYGCFGKIKI